MPEKQIFPQNFKRVAILFSIVVFSIIPLAIFGLSILLGLLFRFISLAFY